MRYELFIGLRYLRARRRETFISLITVISVLGVMIGVMTLNVVMAVMTGFEETLPIVCLESMHTWLWSNR
jgi:lipoprotein-releasing system permease protein